MWAKQWVSGSTSFSQHPSRCSLAKKTQLKVASKALAQLPEEISPHPPGWWLLQGIVRNVEEPRCEILQLLFPPLCLLLYAAPTSIATI